MQLSPSAEATIKFFWGTLLACLFIVLEHRCNLLSAWSTTEDTFLQAIGMALPDDPPAQVRVVARISPFAPLQAATTLNDAGA